MEDQKWEEQTGGTILRSVDGLDARNAILEAVAPQTRHVVVHDLDLPAVETGVVEQLQLVIGAILRATWRR